MKMRLALVARLFLVLLLLGGVTYCGGGDDGTTVV